MQTAHFTLAYWCVLIAAIIPLGCSVLAKWKRYGRSPLKGGFDNANPREWLARQTEWRGRANAAQANSFEALPFFMAAVIIAHMLGAPQGRLDLLAFLWVFFRMLYVLMYVANYATARSAVWGIALLVNVAILFLGYR